MSFFFKMRLRKRFHWAIVFIVVGRPGEMPWAVQDMPLRPTALQARSDVRFEKN
ncbi:hypothetical protein QG37_07275 [Candidozyma auris]|uniref:Uncharacterized protein n=1 Tax=Candidozyma auris TaxID=498019 RepID=A0A0L0NQS9_CANAR|nr:hypothetical protein QG37_07275 [[Candida] auris]